MCGGCDDGKCVVDMIIGVVCGGCDDESCVSWM